MQPLKGGAVEDPCVDDAPANAQQRVGDDIGAGIVMGGDQSTSYIGTELIEFLRPKNQGRP